MSETAVTAAAGCKRFKTDFIRIKNDYGYGANRRHASDISEITIALADQPYIKKLEHIQQMDKRNNDMLVGSIEAFVDKDLEKANEVIKRDDVVDDLFDKVKKELIQMIHENADKGEQAADLLMVAKYMERIGDTQPIFRSGLFFPLQENTNP